MLKIQSTSNIPLDVIKDFQSLLSSNFDVETEGGQFFHKSSDPPTWITLIAEAEWWMTALGAAAVIFVKTLIQEVAKSTWKGLSKATPTKTIYGNAVKIFANNTFSFVENLAPRTQLFLSIPIPDKYNASSLNLTLGSCDEIAMQVALFAHHLPGLLRLIKNEISPDDRILGSFQLTLLEDGSLKVVWKTMSFDLQSRVLILSELG